MAKVGLAAELAKQAAQAAREEMQGAAPPAAAGALAPAAPKAAGPWVPPQLEPGFSLDMAVGTAVGRVAAHYRQKLAHEGLDMAVVTDMTQGVPVFQADLREGGTGRVVRAYNAPDLLSMFAAQQRRNGVVVDGQV